MRALSILLVFASLAFNAAVTNADGLVYKLPEDGQWIKYNLKISRVRGDEERVMEGTFTILSVGQETVDGKKCRWIEMHYNVDREKVVAKVLIPEKEFAKGGKPTDNIVRGWLKLRDNDVVAIDETNKGPMPGFLAAPLSDVKKLDDVELDTKLGKLKCAGLTGKGEYKDRSSTYKIEYTTRLHDKAPFGVVSSKMKVVRSQGDDGEDRPYGTMDFTVAEAGGGAKTKLPESK